MTFGNLFNLGNDEYMVCHGDGCAMKMAEESAQGKDAIVEYDGYTHLISLQGPKAHEFLDNTISLYSNVSFHYPNETIHVTDC